MSDGPHRSLPMRRAWKQLAEYADNQTFEPDQIRDAVIPALERDCKGEIAHDFLSKFHQVCGDRENSLFKTDTQPLESLRAEAGAGIGRVVLEYAIQAAAQGAAEKDIALKAMTQALTDRAARGARQVEEHYYRKSTKDRAHRVRERIERGIGSADMGGLARRVLNRAPAKSAARPSKRNGIDDGVKL
jgi:hypothetical protein